jgi:hypothetical protein
MSELTEQIRATCDSIAENQKKVYDLGLEQGKNLGGYSEGFEAGKKSQNEVLYNATLNEKREVFDFAFAYYNDEIFNPTKDIVPISTARYMFFKANITAEQFEKALKEVNIDTSKLISCDGVFSTMNYIKELPFDISAVSATTTKEMFAYNPSLETIRKIIVSATTPFNNTFARLINLVNLIVEGTIGQNGFNVQESTKLSKASWVSIMTAASTTASITITGSLVSVNKAFETSEGANDGSTSPGWLALKAARPTVSVSLV